MNDFMDELPLIYRNCCYQMDGTYTPSTPPKVFYLESTDMFEDRWVGTYGSWKWPAKYPDLALLAVYFRGHI